eukprot:45442_1
MTMQPQIKQTCAALKRYYNSLSREYDDVFSNYCQTYAIDDELLTTQLEGDPLNCILVGFDEAFPAEQKQENTPKYVFSIIKMCKDNKDISFRNGKPIFGNDVDKSKHALEELNVNYDKPKERKLIEPSKRDIFAQKQLNCNLNDINKCMIIQRVISGLQFYEDVIQTDGN